MQTVWDVVPLSINQYLISNSKSQRLLNVLGLLFQGSAKELPMELFVRTAECPGHIL